MIRKKIGQGSNSSIYEYGEGLALKLYEEEICEKYVKREYIAHSLAEKQNASVPRILEVAKQGKQTGLLFEYIEGDTFRELVTSNLFLIKKRAREFAQALLNLHKVTVENEIEGIDYVTTIRAVKNLDEDTKNSIINYTNSLPSSNKLCHGNYSIDNVLVRNETLYIIDFMESFKGSPLEEIPKVLLNLESPYFISDLSKPLKFIAKVFIKKFKKEFIKEYFKYSSYGQKDINLWLLPTAALRLIQQIPGEEEWLKEIISKEIEKIK